QLAPLSGGVGELLLESLEGVCVGLDANLDRATRLVGVDVVKRRRRRAAGIDDVVDQAVSRRVMAALEAREIENDDVRVPGRELGGPYFLDAVGGVVLRPHILDP